MQIAGAERFPLLQVSGNHRLFTICAKRRTEVRSGRSQCLCAAHEDRSDDCRRHRYASSAYVGLPIPRRSLCLHTSMACSGDPVAK